MLRTFTLLVSLLFVSSLVAQMATPRGELYGNEWVTPGTTYLKIAVTEDGMYRLDPATLQAAGFALTAPAAGQYILHHFGQAVPLEIAADGLYFYGQQARGELDTYLFEQGQQQQLNPRYGMHTDTAVYYLSVAAAGTAAPRFTTGGGAAGAGPVSETIYRTAERVFSDHQSKFYRRDNSNTILFSHYELAEGYGSRKSGDLLSSNGTTETVTELDLPAVTSGTATLTLRYGLAFGDNHLQQISVNGQQLDERRNQDWSVQTQQYTFPAQASANVKIKGLAGDQDKANLAYIQISYPAATTLSDDQLYFTLPAGGATTLRFASLPAGTRLYELSSGTVYRPAGDEFILPAATSERRFQLMARAPAPAATSTVTLEETLPAADATYLILASRRLSGAGIDAVAAHRSSALGGSHHVHTVYVEDLYDSFGYGYGRHPQAMKNYVDAALAQAPGLRYLFIIGKGREYTSLRNAADLADAQETFFVPGYGLPASDNLISAPLGEVTPRLATGRLAAITPQEVAIYATKLRAVEQQIELAGQTIEDLDWMKQALFLGGGQSPSEQASIRYNLGTMEDIFEKSTFGGNVTSVFRTSSDPIETTRQEAIFERINAGTSIITFYGHSSSQGFDFNIDNPDNYNNKDKYPFMMSLGCYSGDAFTESRSISERFIFLPDGGAVTFAASKGIGFISALGVFGRSVFDHVGNEQYGQGIGDALKAVVSDYAGTSNYTMGLLLEQFSLSGDPAFRFHPRPGPDVVIDPSQTSVDPNVVPAQDTSFMVKLRTLNLGSKAADVPDSLLLHFRQQLPSGEVRDLTDYRMAVPYYDESVTVQLPNVGLEAVGVNRLLITVDADDQIAEAPAAAEANNELRVGDALGTPFTVIANTAKTAYPPPYAVVGPGVELIASSSDPLAPERQYRLQVAHDLSFRSPIADVNIVSPGGVIRYTPTFSLQDSTTYYWRISPDSTSTEDAGFIWSQSSFTYLTDQTEDRVSFALQDPGQLSSGTMKDLIVDTGDPIWRYGRNTNDVQLKNAVYRDRNLPALVWNGTRFNSPHPWRVRAGVQVLVIDSTNNSRWDISGDGSYNSVPGRADPWSFDTRTPEGREGLIRFLQEGIEPGRYVFVYSAQRGREIEYHSDAWLADSARVGRTIYGVLEDEGAEQVRLLQQLGSVPYTFAYVKGKGALAEAIASDQASSTEILVPVYENRSVGYYTSDRVGPSLEWRDMTIRFRNDHISAADSAYFYLYGETESGQRTLLERGPLMLGEQRTYSYDLSGYSAQAYPYLLASLELYDEVDRSVASVDEIYIDYIRPGDVAVSPSIAYSAPESLAQGELSKFTVGYENLSPTAMDSLLIALTVINEQNDVSELSQRQAPVDGRGSGIVTFNLPISEQDTRIRLQLTLNPNGDQPETFTFNNFLNTDLGVVSDRIAPDLKVYYDGHRIRDGELISAKPEILMQLRDESPFRRLDDSSAYFIQLTAPDGAKETIRMADSRVEFIAANPDGENMAEVYFRPELLQDGTYSLVVQASDRSKNASGKLAYQQSFEVVNAQLITNVLTYPNPFTSQTRFVYTLTGNAAPDVFRIQIMTVSGRVVRDIDLLAYEDISPGTHQTDFSWDGTDEYGDLLANGVYLYRVITSDGEGDALEAYDNGTDQYFRNGIGKVVILR
ncbi:hypothetical protein LEM8419_03221 [Neolewinella maritima]|uniref:Gingipain domain-containing protein n=1 Tax=Neolewinella maritima TaxID=1383882 RepID=A0ABM9B561_9BACT|nr:C25 family cysteine peptidase [Neolewinella maritima]CAH1002306.1 hypothetical protein LEM8419_03221 [Neolewinella maritima]